MRFTRESEFGSVSSDFAMDNVNCDGEETTLLDCEYDTEDDCGSHEGAGVVCATDSVVTHSNNIWLEGGTGPYEGNLMVRLPNGRTGPVCDDTFNNSEESDLRKVSICCYYSISLLTDIFILV